MTSSTAINPTFIQTISQDVWTIPHVAECLKQVATQSQLDEEAVCRTILTWLDATPFVASHATGRRFTRLQFIENTLSAAGYMLTLRDFDGWFATQSVGSQGDWHPNDLLPYTPIAPRLVEQESRIAQLEHDLHQMEVAKNRANAELAFVQAERDHFLARSSELIYKSVSADYQNSASWRVSKPLRRFMAWRRGVVFSEPTVQKPSSEELTPPWQQAGYSVEKAWQAAPEEEFDRSDYTEWLRRYDNLAQAELAVLREAAQSLAEKSAAPSFSLLMALDSESQPLHLQWLQEAIASVQAQMYPKWELCIAVAHSEKTSVRIMLDSMVAADPRIKLVYSTPSERLLDAALVVATGDWVGILSAINKVAVLAINTVARAVLESNIYDIIYTDSDRLFAPNFERSAPDFKPDWNVDLFLSTGSSQNYTQDLCFYKMDLVRELGGMVSGHDLISRALECKTALKIHHIPQVLVHVRQIGAAAENKLALTYTQYPIPTVPPLVSMIIPTKNNVVLLRQCIESILRKTVYQNYEILVVDNGSDQDDTLDYLQSLRVNPKIRVIRDNYAFNYSALNNYAVTFAKGEVLALINDDIEVDESASIDWLTEMVSHAVRPGVGAVGARLWYPNQTLQHAGMVLVGGLARHVHKHLPKGAEGFNGRAVLNTKLFSSDRCMFGSEKIIV